MRRRSPQEKKALSYAKDRRNLYGENDKSSRKNIRRNKRIPHRADRHRYHQGLAAAAGSSPDNELIERATERLNTEKSKRVTMCWHKHPDRPLAEALDYRLNRRTLLGINTPAATESRLARIRRRT